MLAATHSQCEDMSKSASVKDKRKPVDLRVTTFECHLLDLQ